MGWLVSNGTCVSLFHPCFNINNFSIEFMKIFEPAERFLVKRVLSRFEKLGNSSIPTFIVSDFVALPRIRIRLWAGGCRDRRPVQ